VSSAAASRTNISLFTSDVQSLYRKYTTHAKIINPGSSSSLASGNAGIVLNYRLTESGPANYHVAVLDVVNSTFGIYFFNGVTLAEVASIVVPDLRRNDWYEITFQGIPAASQIAVDLTATLTGITDPSITATVSVSVSSSVFGADSGAAGLYSNRSNAYFSFWRIDEAP
jgi:hypothetical protein